MTLVHRPARPGDAAACIDLRGRTRQNAIPAHRLAEWGITPARWDEDIRSGATPGVVALAGATLAGFCFGSRDSGEVQVLAVAPAFEGQGLGRALLAHTVQQLAALGWQRLWLATSPDPASRSHGFYRRLGWRPTGELDRHGDEILALQLQPPA